MLHEDTKKQLKYFGCTDFDKCELYFLGIKNKLDVSWFPEEIIEACEKVESPDFKVEFTDEWISAWNKLWPTQGDVEKAGNYDTSYSPRQSLPEVKKRMKGFVKTFHKRLEVNKRDYPLKDVLNIITTATQFYLEDRRTKRFEFIKKSSKFISDVNGSALESWCRKVITNQVTKSQRKSETLF